MKRIFSLCLVLCLVLGLGGCKKKTEELSIASPTDVATKTDLATETDTASGSSAVTASKEELCDHDFSAATCTTAKTCKICKESEGEALGHKWNTPTCKTFKTCTRCKKTEPEKGDHTYKNGYCTVCDKKDPDFGALTSHEWQLMKSSRLITISFKNTAFSEAVMEDISKMSDEERAEIFSGAGAEENVITINGKDWYGVTGQGLYISYKEEKGTITVHISDDSNPDEFGRQIVLKRISSTTLKVTKCTLKGSFWKIRVGDVLTAVTE